MERQTVGGAPSEHRGSEVRQQVGRPHRADRSALELVVSRLHRPLLRPGTVRRSSLIERLVRGDACPIVSVVAPPGYGKTTLLSQWAERNGQAFAWVSVEEADNDPKVLLTYVAEALDGVEPIGERVFDVLASPVSSVPGSVVPRLGSAFSSMTSPVVLALDDVHVLHNSECRAALSVLADHVPDGSRLALAGRAEPPLRIARLRAEGRILEIGPDGLSLTLARRRYCCARLAWRSVRTTWRKFTSGPRGGRRGCTSRPSTSGRAARSGARRSPSAAMISW